MNKYIVKNCPAYKSEIYKNCCDMDGNYKCEGCTDCLIKQVIEKCKEHPFCDCACGDEILQLFDIDEVK